MKKIVFIIPGFGHSPTKKIYKDIANIFIKNGFEVVMVGIKWRYTTPSQWVDQFINEYYQTDQSKKYVFGFSYGAIISFISSTKVSIDTQILCSLSPYFKEDLPVIPKWWKIFFGKRRINELDKLSVAKLSPQIQATTYLLYGTKEGRFVETRAKDTFKSLKCKKYLIPIEAVKHDIEDKRYFNEIQKVIQKLI